MSEENIQRKYDWSGCNERLQVLGFVSFAAWCRKYEFNRKTGQALRQGNIVWGWGPKVKAILAQAIVDGLVKIVD